MQYYFIQGYTAKVAGTEIGVTEPTATFSACFGAPFLVWHPIIYAEMLAKKLQDHECDAWLLNTGWTGGAYGSSAVALCWMQGSKYGVQWSGTPDFLGLVQSQRHRV